MRCDEMGGWGWGWGWLAKEKAEREEGPPLVDIL